MKITDRFWSKVKKEDSCWVWNGYRDAKGYGIFCFDGKSKKAHRVAYELAKEPIRRGFEIDHLCENKSCVNPDHLEQVTTRVNTHRAKTTLAYKNAAKKSCPSGHPYSDKNLIISDNGYNGARRCKLCKNAQERARYRAKHKQLRRYRHP